MSDQWIKRRSHRRKLPTGRSATVCEHWVLKAYKKEEKGFGYRDACPECGAQIMNVKMPNGGWVHYEGGNGLWKIKHPCFNRGESLSRRRDEQTLDLFHIK